MKKTAIVTGGTRGIGYAIAKALLDSNHQVSIIYRSDKAKADDALNALKKHAEPVIALQADITKPSDRERIIKQTIDTFGNIETDMSRHAWQDPKKGPALEKAIPLRRRGQAHEIAGAVLHLASENATYTTGADLIIDGGWMLR